VNNCDGDTKRLDEDWKDGMNMNILEWWTCTYDTCLDVRIDGTKIKLDNSELPFENMMHLQLSLISFAVSDRYVSL
jgi:hypothetical protein